MNILVPDSWLREFIKTEATQRKIAQTLSLSSQSVEKVEKVGKDWVYQVEVTTNRPDCLSLYGLARELAAILPRFKIEAKFNSALASQNLLPAVKNSLPLEVQIADPSLCPRFTAIIFDNIQIKPSPRIIQERLAKVGIRALNNVVDISNYLMVELGQPMHTFDYDKISLAKMTLREAREGEKVVTLDAQTRVLPKGAIIIEDGKGRIIDLCGIMGGKNSAVDGQTKRVLLFVQTYDPAKIRWACQSLAFRTEAAARFEKGVNPEGVIPALKKAIKMFEMNCQAKLASNLIDIYPSPPQRKTIKLDLNLVAKVMGIAIPQKEVISILKSLGFSLKYSSADVIFVTVPHWRLGDIFIQEDLIEEIARIYGYHNLPSIIPPGWAESQADLRFFWEEKIKTALKYWGSTEVASYSMVGQDLLQKAEFSPNNCLKISNPLTAELVFLRPSLIPSLLQIISQNEANFAEGQIFEVANIYLPFGQSSLPKETPRLTAAIIGKDFFYAKGILEALFRDLGIKDYRWEKAISPPAVFDHNKTGEITLKNRLIGFLGEIKKKISDDFAIASPVIVFDLELNYLLKDASQVKKYQPIPAYPPIVEDLAFVVGEGTEVGKIIETIRKTDVLVANVYLLDSYDRTRTFRLTYQSDKKSLMDEEVKPVREKIIAVLGQKYSARLKE